MPPLSPPELFPAWENPPLDFRPAVLWSWNGEMTPARIREMLQGFNRRNIGGVFIHPRPGLVTEYLSEEWFSLWSLALEESKRLGIGCHIYDENSFPSGFAGGHVVSPDPLAANSRLAGHWVPEHSGKSDPTGWRMGFLSLARAGDSSPDSESSALAMDLEEFPSDLWHGGFPMADVCRTEVTGRFLESTHAAYAARFSGDFGKSIRYVFTDEPETGTSDRGFYMSRAFLDAFRAEHGYALESRIQELCGSLPDSPAVRHDYFLTLNRLFTQNFARQCHDWCENQHLAFTGHFLENQWPFPNGCPSTMAAQRWMHSPGVDLLGFQFSSATLQENALWLLSVKEATSVAAQCGRVEVLCESCGGGGYGYGPAEMKPLEDFLLALGVNRIVPHLAHESLAGARKYDWPQTISEHSPWWDAFGTHALHIARANYLLSQGTGSNRTLVLHPTTTAWLHYRPQCFHLPDEEPHAPLEALRESHAGFLAELYSAGVDFDLGDELVMAEFGDGAPMSHASHGTNEKNGSYAAAALKIGGRAYETVVVPAGMENMFSSTVRMLGDFLNAGGTVFCAGAAPVFVDGRPSDFPLARLPGWVAVSEGLIARLRQRHPPLISSPDGSPLPADLLWRHSSLPDGAAILFFSNPSTSPISAEIAVGAGTAFDTFSGLRSSLVVDSGHVSLTLPPGGHALWHVADPGFEPSQLIQSSPTGIATPVEFLGCAPVEANIIQLDYCDYSGPQTELRDLNTLHADNANWRAHGFDQNLWRVSIQFRRTFLEAPIPDGSGFSVRFSFYVSDRFASSDKARDLHVAVERPWLYEIFCNGVMLPQEKAEQWFDEEICLLPVGGNVVAGANVIELRARQFHVLAEIMPVFLRGAFRVMPRERGFLLEPSL
ncbi:MAG: glycosyl hydrolase, partial [Verrucomicrobiota bacterium]